MKPSSAPYRDCHPGLAACLVLALAPAPALAQSGPEDAVDPNRDQGRFLVLVSPPITDMNPQVHRRMMSAIDLHRFEMRDVDYPRPDAPVLLEWCTKEAIDMAQQNGLVDASGSPLLTYGTLKAACSKIYTWRIRSSSVCPPPVDEQASASEQHQGPGPGPSPGRSRDPQEPEPADPICTVTVSAEIEHFLPAAGTKTFRLARDESFGLEGTLTVEASASTPKTGFMNAAFFGPSLDPSQPGGLASLTGAGGNDVAAAEAAAFLAGQILWQRIRAQVPEFPTRGVVTSNVDGHTYSCLSKRTTSLDEPFQVLTSTDTSPVAYVKAREIHDGCHRLPSMNEEGVVIRPMKAENILGGAAIRPGMFLREISTIGLGLGATVGSSPLFSELGQPTLGVRAEFNLAPLVGISEFHAVVMARLAVYTGGTVNLGSRMQLDLGVLKREYFWGPLFIEGGGLLTGTGGLGGDAIQTLGVSGIGGLGLQVNPRWTARVTAGVRAAAGFGANSGEIGPIFTTDGLYTF